MKCQEVMMYMQRQLDGDLAPEEENELHAHLMHCSDCAQMFERLRALSNELSQLPKVTPPFSLVDAIMPQLLQLDKQNETNAADNVVVFPSKVARTELEEDMPKRAGLSRFKEQFSWKFASGVVAAGLIIGFFAFNLGNPVIDNADGIMSRSSSDSKSAPEKRATATSQENQSTENNHIAKNQENAGSSSSEGSPIAPTADLFVKGTGKAEAPSDNGGNAPQATSNAQLEKPGAYSSPASGGEIKTNKILPSTSAPERLKDPEVSVPKSDKVDLITEGTSPPASLNVPQSTLEPKPTESSKKMTPAPSVDPSSSDRISASQGIYSLTIPQGDVKLKSPTGIYEATIEDAHVEIRHTQTLEIVFASKHVWQAEDQIKLLEWSKDDKLFYEVTSKGVLQTILIDVKEKTEANK